MKVAIEEGNFSIRLKLDRPFPTDRGLALKEMELPITYGTLRQFLAECSHKYKYAGRFPVALLDPRSRELGTDFGVSVNGVEYELLPERLETRLKEGDELEITMVMLGGG